MHTTTWIAGSFGWATFLVTSLACAQPRVSDSPARSDMATPAMRTTLDDALARALARNPTYATALLEVRRAGAVVRETKAAWLPTIYGYGGFTHLDSKRVEGNTVLLAQNELAANVTVTVPLVMTRQWLTTQESRIGADATRATSADVRRLVAYSTAQAYLAVYAQKLVIEVNERARDTARSHAAYAHQRYAGGVGNSIDEVRATQEAATDDALVQQAYALLASDEEALGIVVGAEGPLDTAEEPTLAEPPSLGEALDRAGRRPDVVALDLRSQAARKTVDDEWSNYAPSVVGVAQPFYQNPATPTVPQAGYSLDLLLTVPLYDGGLRNGQHDEHAALREEASVAFDAGLRQARSDVRAAFEALRRADDALRSSRDAAQLAKRTLELANIAYHAGATTNIEVIDAERQARDAATQAQMAADGARQARLTMLVAADLFPDRRGNST
ncbi:MAG: TolC family protein [Polyangiaceae bacterium]|jgi:outer membrane protein TolC